MHLEFLTEDSSGKRLLEILLPQLVDLDQVSYNIHSYKGVGRIPKNLKSSAPKHRILLEQLPRLLEGYGRTPGVDGAVVCLDSDDKDCRELLQELHSVLEKCKSRPNTLFRLAIEETEAWYLGDQPAILMTYPKAKKSVLAKYQQDSVCGTWELLGDAVYPGGSAAIKKAGWPKAGIIKHEWANAIGPQMNVEDNQSPSFRKLRDGLRSMVSSHLARERRC